MWCCFCCYTPSNAPFFLLNLGTYRLFLHRQGLLFTLSMRIYPFTVWSHKLLSYYFESPHVKPFIILKFIILMFFMKQWMRTCKSICSKHSIEQSLEMPMVVVFKFWISPPNTHTHREWEREREEGRERGEREKERFRNTQRRRERER